MADSIYDLIKHDHELVKPMLVDMTTGRTDQLNQMTDMLAAHLGAEETVFYKRLESNADIRDEVTKMYEEHQQARQVVRQLAGLRDQDSEFRATATMLLTAIGQHIEKEEGWLFSQAQTILSGSDAETIGREFVAEEQRLMAAPVGI